MIIDNTNGLRILYPDEGKILTNGVVYSDSVYLAVNASENNWREVTRDEIDETDMAEELTAEEALNIIVGGTA